MTSRGATRPHVVIVGLMGVGKTTVAEAIAQRLGRPLRDSDADIERLIGRTGSRITAEAGVDDLHQLEEAVLLGALAAEEPAVIAAAGWVVESAACRDALARRAVVVWLRAGPDELARRMATGHHRRSLAPGELEEIVRRRAPLFASVADLVVPAEGPVDEVVEQVVTGLTMSD